MKSIFNIVLMSLVMGVTLWSQGQWEIVNQGFAYEFGSVDFIDENTGWHVGGKGLFKTTDGAENWSLVNDFIENFGTTRIQERWLDLSYMTLNQRFINS